MKRLISISLVGAFALLTLACSGTADPGGRATILADATTTTSEASVAAPPPTTIPGSVPPSTAAGGGSPDTTSPPAIIPTTATPATPPPLWTRADLPAIDNLPGNPSSGSVVLVADDDVLNVRAGAGVHQPIVGKLVPRAVVAMTGAATTVNGSEWVEILTPDGVGWVNRFYLGIHVDPSDFNTSDEVHALLDRMAQIVTARGDLTEVVSQRGLFIAHNAPLVHFEVDELPGLMTDSTTYQWGSAALEADSPELPYRTFAEAVGDRYVSAYLDSDVSVRFSEVELGGNGTLPEYAIPFELGAFNFVSVYDPGDDRQYGGLDWTAWYVSIDYEEEGRPVVVAMTLNEWSP